MILIIYFKYLNNEGLITIIIKGKFLKLNDRKLLKIS
jgi:hypothetical protein